MSLSESLSSAAGYTRRIFDNAGDLILIYLMAIFGIIPVLNFFYLGYLGRVVGDSSSSNKPPKLERAGDMFVDGLKYFLAIVLWAIPIIILAVIAVVVVFLPLASVLPSGSFFNATFWQNFNSTNWGELFRQAYVTNAAAAAVVPVVVLLALLAVLIAIFALMGIVHMFKTKSFTNAFAIGDIFSIISKIGWLRYLGLIAVAIVLGALSSIFDSIPLLGYFIAAFLSMLLAIFILRAAGLMYDTAIGNAPAAPASTTSAPPPLTPPPSDSQPPPPLFKYCTACGAANPIDASYCNKCGQKLQ